MRAHLLTIGQVFAVLWASGCGDPKLEPDCSMNGFGQGTCSFTNTGSSAGGVCGYLVVSRTLTASSPARRRDGPEATDSREAQRDAVQLLGFVRSSVFCSGDVGSRETKAISFGVGLVPELCEGRDGSSWRDNCEFEFVSEEKLTELVRRIANRSDAMEAEQRRRSDALEAKARAGESAEGETPLCQGD